MKHTAHRTLLPLLLAAVLMAACRDVPVVETEAQQGNSLKENLINANRYIAGSEEAQIDGYVGRRGWQMQKLAAGARVMETARGTGRRVEYEDTLHISYRLEAIDGQTLYGSVDDTVVVGRLQPTRGLDAALRTLHHGSQAVVVLPSEQGYGVAGDGDRVGPRMILIYKIKINN